MLISIIFVLIIYFEMEERIGSILIVVNDREQVQQLNQIISQYSDCIIGRQGISLKDRNQNIIALVLVGNTDQLGGLSGQLGRLKGIQVKSTVIKNEKL